MAKMTYQELMEIAKEEQLFSLKDVEQVITGLIGEAEDVYHEYSYAQSPRKKLKDIAKLISDNNMTILGDADEYHNIAVNYARKNLYDSACFILDRGLLGFPYSSDLLADKIRYGIDGGQIEVADAAYEQLMQVDNESWGWRAYSFTIDYYLSKATQIRKGIQREELRAEVFNMAEGFISHAIVHIEDSDFAYFSKSKAIREFGGEETEEEVLRTCCETVKACPRCALRLSDILFDRGEYNDSIKYLKLCMHAAQKPQPDVSPSYVYLLTALGKTSKLFTETSDRNYESKRTEIEQIYRDFHTALSNKDINPIYEETAKATIRVLEVQTGVKDLEYSSSKEEFI